MPRFPMVKRFRRHKDAPEEPRPPAVRRRAPSPGALRRERRAILKAREELLRDLGGLAMEMYRRDQFREDLLSEHARDIANLETRLHELDSMLAAAAAGRRATTSRCECGAPIIWGSHFCANCGRPVGAEPVVSCEGCGHPLPADAEFCPSCGRAASESSANGDRRDEATMIGESPQGQEHPPEPADQEPQPAPADRWEE